VLSLDGGPALVDSARREAACKTKVGKERSRAKHRNAERQSAASQVGSLRGGLPIGDRANH
jgi:hypothetical protein